jgi:hypothetical protein
VTLPDLGAAGLVADLLLLALAAIAIGEPIRSILGRWSGWLARVDPVERALLDLYLGGALVYLVAAVPFGLFYPVVIVLVALVPWGVRLYLGPSILAGARDATRSIRGALGRWPYLVGLGSFLALLAVEAAAAAPVPTGNTYDSSLYGLYSSLLLLHHTLPTSLAPVDPVGLAFPQGPTVWFTLGQGLLGWPAVRSSLLATPLFLALGVPAGFVLGRRWWGTPEAGAAVGIVVGLLGPFPREIVAGSNDLALSLPLVILLAGFARGWSERPGPSWADALAFGGLAGYAAALNPVGPEWLFLTVLGAAAIATPRLAGDAGRWLARWIGAIAIALVFVSPSLAVLVQGRSSPGLVPGGAQLAPGAPFGTSVSQFVGGIDPFLFRPSDTWLSPFPALRAELAVLIVIGALLLLLGATGRGPGSRAFGRMALAGGGAAILIIGSFVITRTRAPGFSDLAYLSSATETSVVLFLVYTFVAAVPLIYLFERVSRPDPVPSDTPERQRSPRPQLTGAGALAVVLALAVILPGAGVTAFSLPGQLQSVYDRYSNVTPDDLTMLQYAAGHIPDGSRVLVAPGSAAEFLPVFDPELVLLYPMVPNFRNVNASYGLLVQELTNATLDANGRAALAELNVSFVAVTGASSTLFAPFDPQPLEEDSELSVAFQQGDAWLFQVEAA